MPARRPSARAPARHADDIRLTPQGLELGSRRIPLRSGAVHYFRLPPTRWPSALAAVRDMGLSIVESYVPWSVHERPDGSHDFGDQDPGKNLSAFLDLARGMGLFAFLRPGPNVNGELPGFGVPNRVLMDPECQARSPRGAPVPVIAPPRMFPAPSYASRRFRDEAGRWLESVAARLEPHVWPNGPLVLTQVDNEAAYFFRDGPYDQDYHPDALADYRAFLRDRYESLARLAAAYGVETPADWSEVAPPEGPPGPERGALLRCADWAEHQGKLLADALAEMRGALARGGLSRLPAIHNLPMGDAGGALSLSQAGAATDGAGLDYYHGRRGLIAAKRRTLHLVGTGGPSFAPELGMGAPPWFGRRDDDDALACALWASAYGLRGFNVYMAVERNLWFGAPADASGRARPLARRIARLIRALDACEFHQLERRTPVAIQLPREYAHWTRATHCLGPLSPTLLALSGLSPGAASNHHDYGFGTAIQRSWAPLVERLSAALTRRGVPHVFVDSDQPALPPGVKLLLAPSYGMVARERWQRLCELAGEGIEVVWGPQLPRVDERLSPLPTEPPCPGPTLCCDDLPEAERLVDGLVDRLGLASPISIAPAPLEVTVHRADGEPRLLFALNPTAEDALGELHLDRPMALVDAMDDERFEGDSVVRLPLPARGCRLLRVEEAGGPA